MSDRKQLIALAKEINIVMGLEGKDKIKTVAVKTDALLAEVLEVSADLDPKKDKFTQASLNTLKEIGVKKKFKLAGKVGLGSEKIKSEDKPEEVEEKEIGADLNKGDKSDAIKVAKDLVKTLDYPPEVLLKMEKMGFKDLLDEIANIAGMINEPYEDEKKQMVIPNDQQSDFKELTVEWLEKAGIEVKWGTEEKPEKEKPTEKEKGKPTAGKKDEKVKGKDKPKSAVKGEMLSLIEKFVKEKKWTRKEIIEKVHKEMNHVVLSTIGTIISDSKNPKYNKLPKLVKQDDKGILSF